jgi:hypothetical protein
VSRLVAAGSATLNKESGTMKNKRQCANGKMPLYPSSLFLIAVLCFLISAMCPLTSSSLAAPTNYPAWWTNRNVITNMTFTNDYTYALQGQLKWVATNAYVELSANLPNGAGTNLLNLIQTFTSSNNYCFANIGQLKYAAKPFYDRLITEGYTNSYPWTSTYTDDLDYAFANIGQLKSVFSFDLTKDSDGDGLVNWIETGTGIFVSPWNTGSSATTNDTDHDGILDGVEVTNRTDPCNSDTNKPTVWITYPANNSQWRLLP